MVLFLFVFKMIYSGEKKEIKANNKKVFSAIGAAFILAFAPTLAFGFILFVLFGSATFISTTFLLNFGTNKIALLVIALYIYLYTIDNIIEFAINYVLGRHGV